jgi:hypothetical protein
MRRAESFKGGIGFKFQTNFGYELGDQVGKYEEKNQSRKSHASVPAAKALMFVQVRPLTRSFPA